MKQLILEKHLWEIEVCKAEKAGLVLTLEYCQQRLQVIETRLLIESLKTIK